MKLKVNIVGAGKLGKTIGRLIIEKGLGTIAGVCNRTPESAREAVQFIGQGEVVERIADLPSSDLVFITTPDHAILTCCTELTKSPFRPIVTHCSGVLSSSMLVPVRSLGCLVASVHPLRSFADPTVSANEFAGTFCAVEGDNLAKDALKQLFGRLGAQCFEVNPDKKVLYHASAVFASNYLVTLYDTAVNGLKSSGLDDEHAAQVTLSLMEGTLRNLKATRSAQQSLTGPIKRGDLDTIERHWETLGDGPFARLYKELALATLDLAKLSPERKEKIRDLFSRE